MVDTRLILNGLRAYDVARERELGKAGARMGADAVILTDTALRFTLPVHGGSRAPQEWEVRFEGLAVRWIPDTCDCPGVLASANRLIPGPRLDQSHGGGSCSVPPIPGLVVLGPAEP